MHYGYFIAYISTESNMLYIAHSSQNMWQYTLTKRN